MKRNKIPTKKMTKADAKAYMSQWLDKDMGDRIFDIDVHPYYFAEVMVVNKYHEVMKFYLQKKGDEVRQWKMMDFMEVVK